MKTIISKQCKDCRANRPIVNQPSDPSYRIIPLTKGKVCFVDTFLYDWLNQWQWYVMCSNPKKIIYAVRAENSVTIYMHREILGLTRDDHRQVDHINRDGLDNRSSNLRLSDQQENSFNRSIGSNNTSGYKGVTYNKASGKWMARIHLNRKSIYLGMFTSPKTAYEAYCAAAIQYYGDFACFG